MHPEEPMVYFFYCERCELPIRRKSDVSRHVKAPSEDHAIVEKKTVVMRKKKRRTVRAPGDIQDEVPDDRDIFSEASDPSAFLYP